MERGTHEDLRNDHDLTISVRSINEVLDRRSKVPRLGIRIIESLPTLTSVSILSNSK